METSPSLSNKALRLMSVRGRYVSVTLKFYVNFLVYVVLRTLLPLFYGTSKAVRLIKERRLLWTNFPFDLSKEVLWNPDLRAWLDPESLFWAEGLNTEGDMPPQWFDIKKGDVFMEIGAHVGYWTVPISQKTGKDGLVLAIEPHADNFQKLLLHLGSNNVGNCIPIRAACWNERKPMWLELSEFSEQHHIEDKPKSHGVWVYGITVDGLSDALGLNQVDWIKMDVEGAECEVLEASQSVLDHLQPTLLIEVHGTWKRFLPLLEKLRYEVVDLRGDSTSTARGHVLAKPMTKQ